MARRKRQASTFNLSFLDIMSCGFGAVVLVFLIIDHSMEVESRTINAEVFAEIDLLEEQIAEGKKGLVRLRNDVKNADPLIVEAKGLADQASEDLDEIKALLASLDEKRLDGNNIAQDILEDIKQLESSIKKLKVERDAAKEKSAVNFAGDGRRQYLNGIRTDGNRVLILLDRSASMLSNSLLNIAALKYFPIELRLKTEKWTQAISSLKWIVSNLNINSYFQIIIFNDDAQLVSNERNNPWTAKNDSVTLLEILALLDDISPNGGSNFYAGFSEAFSQETMPDNIFLITDGLPTKGQEHSGEMLVSAEDRLRLYRQAVKIIPPNIPVNVILLPMEGEPQAALAFWELAYKTKGSVLAPTRGWP